MKLRKILSVTVATVAVAIIGTVTASAETLGDYRYRYDVLNDGTVEITDYTGSDTELEIPSEIDGKTVTSIGDDAFFRCYSLTSITIPDSVTSIGDRAFFACDSIMTITISKSVTNIDNFAFSSCIGLENIIVDENNEHFSVEDGVLFNKDKTELIQYPTGNERTTYTIPDSVTSIGDGAFSCCDSLTSITIPDSVTSIGGLAFSCCDSLTSITIPDSVTSIGNYAFEYCDKLTIKCSPFSEAQKYAKKNNIDYTYTSGSIVFIVVCCVVVFAIITAVVIILIRRKKKKTATPS